MKMCHFRLRRSSDAALVQQKKSLSVKNRKTGFFEHTRRLLLHVAARLRSPTFTKHANLNMLQTIQLQHATIITLRE